MKMTLVLLTFACLHVYSRGTAQSVSLKVTNAPVITVLEEIKKQTGYDFFFNVKTLESAGNVTVAIQNVSLQQALDACFTGTSLTYSITGKVIVISEKENATNGDVQPQTMNGPPGEFRGRVTNANGQPLSGANVIIKRIHRGTITNANGEFTLRDLKDGDILIVSFVGYKSQEIPVKGRGGAEVTLELAKNELDKVVVQAYGKTSQRLATGNIATVTAEEIEKQPVVNPLQALQGRVAGLDVSQTIGYVSAPFHVELRGRNTIGQFPTDPLYIIDGVPLTVPEITNGSTTSRGFVQNPYMGGPAGGQSPFFSINPADIETITVLKDADATSIYGSRGANGVIIITTKSGSVGKTNFEVHFYQGMSAVTRHYDLMNTPEYLAMRREAIHNDGYDKYLNNPQFKTYFYDLVMWDTTGYTDWQKYLWGNIGKTTNVQASLSGGNKQTSFRLGAGYEHITDITTFQGANQRGSLHFNFSHKSLDQKLNVSFTNLYTIANTNMVDVSALVLAPPNAPPVFDKNGNINFLGWYPAQGLIANFGRLKQPYEGTTYFINSRLGVGYELVKGLTASVSLGYSNASVNQTKQIPIISQDPTRNPTGSSQFGYNTNLNWIAEPEIKYNTLIGPAKLEVLVGGSTQSVSLNGSYVEGNNYVNDNLLGSVANAPHKDAFDYYSRFKYAAIFGRVNYNWENKYIVNISARRDGSSRFGPGKQFGNFGAVGAAWIFSEEHFFKNLLPFVSLGKIRGSYGTTGNDQIGDYQYLTRWSGTNIVPYEGNPSYVPLQHANPDYQWQVNRKLELALDLGFISDKVHAVLAWYRNRCDNQLINYPLPYLTGFPFVTANWPADVENTGIELNVSGKIIDQKDWSWNVSFNLARNTNKLIAFPNLQQSVYANSLFIGQSLDLGLVLHSLGVDPQTGTNAFQDKNKDGTISTTPGPAGDLYPINLAPKFYGGLGTDIRYEGLQLSLFFEFKKKIGANAFATLPTPGQQFNQPVEVLNRWQHPGDKAEFARYITNNQVSDNYLRSSDAAFTDASFIRLNNFSLSYTLPAKLSKRAAMTNCRFFLQGQNIFVITKYKGVDPETQTFSNMPPAKIIAGGIDITF